jgi:hypothetical protein
VDPFLDPTTSGGKTSALFRQPRDALVSGRLAAGDRLPPTPDIDRVVGIRLSTSALADRDGFAIDPANQLVPRDSILHGAREVHGPITTLVFEQASES